MMDRRQAVANSTRSISVALSASALGSRLDGMAFRKRKYLVGDAW